MQENKENFLDSKSLIAIVFLIISWVGWGYYMKQKYPAPLNVESEDTAPILEKEEKTEKTEETEAIRIVKKTHKEETLTFKGENMEILFSSKGFGIKQLKLKKYHNRDKELIVFDQSDPLFFSNFFFQEKETPIPFEIKKEGKFFVGLFSSPEWKIKKTIEVDEKAFVLKNKIEIHPLKAEKTEGLSLVFSHPKPEGKVPSGLFKFLSIYGQDILKAFVSYDGNRTKRFTVKDIDKNNKAFSNINVVALGGRYFGKAFINKSSFFPSVTFEKDSKRIQARVDYVFLHSKVQNLEYTLFLGPKSLKNLQNLQGEIQKWLDFGFFGWLARPLLLFLNWLYHWCNNWGLAIILLTFFVRLALFPINIKSYKSMKVMQKIQPQIKQLKKKHKSDPKKMNLEVMALMKQQKANPLGGCLPLFIQFPVFIALYRVLGESIELYQSPFLFWIKDLSLKDPYFILPVLGGLVLFVQQRLTPMNLPKEQARLLTIMPLFFSVFMLSFPSGLTLYIFVSGLFGLVQQFFFVKLGSSYLKGGENVKTV